MYPAYDGDWRGSFIRQMVRDLETRGITVKKAVKSSSSVIGYVPFYYQSMVLARDTTPDIFQAEYIPHSSLIPAYFRRQNVPLVLKFHGDDARIYPFKNRFNMTLTRTMLKHAAHVITASEEMRRLLIDIGGNPDTISAIHTGVDTEFFSLGSKEQSRKSLDLPADATVFLFVGRLHPSKGINELLEVARQCPDLLFRFVGSGISVPVFSDNCKFVGEKIPEEVRTWMYAADCLVLPTHTEAVPTSVMEAFACGIPAITTDIGGCPEIVEDGKNGLLVPVGDIKTLYDAVRWMHNNPESRADMGKQARIKVLEQYDHHMQIEQLINVHRSLIK